MSRKNKKPAGLAAPAGWRILCLANCYPHLSARGEWPWRWWWRWVWAARIMNRQN